MLDGNFPWPMLGVLCLGLLAVAALHRKGQDEVMRYRGSLIFPFLMIGLLVVILGGTALAATATVAVPALAGGFTPMRLGPELWLTALGVLAVVVVLVKCSE